MSTFLDKFTFYLFVLTHVRAGYVAQTKVALDIGITNFDLLGDFGKIDWLGNLYLVCSYNVSFAIATGLCLAKKFSSTVRRELFDRTTIVVIALRCDRSESTRLNLFEHVEKTVVDLSANEVQRSWIENKASAFEISECIV